MAGIQDRNVIIDRYNHACSAYQSAIAALKRGSVEEYEAGLVGSAQAVWNVLEWAVRFYLEHDCIQQLSTADRELLKKTQFDAWVNLLGKLNPPVDQMTRRQLLQHRVLRNRSFHDGMLPGQRPVLTALASARRFLTQQLLVPAEQLQVAVADAPPESQPAQEPPHPLAQPVPEPTFGEYRKLGLQAWLEQAVAQGVAKARAHRGGRYDATLDSLALEAKALLTRDAVALCLNSRAPDDLLVASESSVEEEVQRLLFAGPAPQLDAQSVTRLRHLVPLIQRRTSLCVDAGWLKHEGQGVAFTEPALPVLLVGAGIAGQGADPTPLRTQVGEQLGWAEAGWAAVSAGDDVHHWASLLRETQPSPSLLSRVLAAASAFGAAPTQTVATDSLIQAFRVCVLTLVWCSPVRKDAFDRKQEQDCPWFLPEGAWRRAILDLAQLASVLKTDDRFLVQVTDRNALPEPLKTIVKSLDLPLRLKEEQAAAVFSLCAPYQAARAGCFDERRFGELSAHDTHQLIGLDLRRSWFELYAIPALWSWDRLRAARLLAMPGDNRPAPLLLNCLEMHDAWIKAWRVFADTTSSEELASAWVDAALILVHHSDRESLDLVRIGFEMIDSRGLGEDVRRRIRTGLAPPTEDPKDSAEPSPVLVDILRRVVETPSHFTKIVEDWTERPALAWRTLLVAGCPDVAIARWCMAKLAAFKKVPPAYRDGPVGIIWSQGAQPLSSGPWQLAFSQAREALDYLLDHGSAEAILVIADACTPRDRVEPKVNPTMGKMPVANLSIPLSQVIWGRVIDRPEGRMALCLLVESGKAPSSLNFFKTEPFQGFEYDVWTKAAAAIGQLGPSAHNAGHGAEPDTLEPPRPSKQQRSEAERLLAAFERRVQDDPWLPWGNGTPARAAVAALTSVSGADVSAPLSALVDELTQGAASRPALRSACLLVGIALRQLAKHHIERAKPILEAALRPALLEAMRRDDTAEFWIAMLSHHGCQRVWAELERLDSSDLGLGFFDALQEVDERALLEWHLRPALMRAALLRAAQQQFSPSEAFWREVWAAERGPSEVPELVFFLDGPWLTQLLEKSSAWSCSARTQLLRHLATHAAVDKVRERCLTALYMMDVQPGDGSVTGEPRPTGGGD